MSGAGFIIIKIVWIDDIKHERLLGKQEFIRNNPTFEELIEDGFEFEKMKNEGIGTKKIFFTLLLVLDKVITFTCFMLTHLF